MPLDFRFPLAHNGASPHRHRSAGQSLRIEVHTKDKSVPNDDEFLHECMGLIRRGAAWLTRMGQPGVIDRADLEQIGMLSFTSDRARGERKKCAILRHARSRMIEAIQAEARQSSGCREWSDRQAVAYNPEGPRISQIEMRRLVRRLPEAQREAVRWVYLVGYTIRDAAPLLGICERRLKRNLAAAKINLARWATKMPSVSVIEKHEGRKSRLEVVRVSGLPESRTA
jgi:DNA-directed RNA polymerase specialized sigma24 family protein